jgi:hypothetical protein
MIYYLQKNKFSDRGYVYSIFSNKKIDNFHLVDLIRPIAYNKPVTPTEWDRELRFFGIGSEAKFETIIYTTHEQDEELYNLFNFSPKIKDNWVISEKSRKGLYRRTSFLDGNKIRKEISGSIVAKNMFNNSLDFLTNSSYKDLYVSHVENDAATYYSYTYKKLAGITLYDYIFTNKIIDVEHLYYKYMECTKNIWPYVHLDLHGDNIIIDNNKWWVIDFESITNMDIETAYLLYHGIFTQVVYHGISENKKIEYMDLDTWKNYIIN